MNNHEQMEKHAAVLDSCDVRLRPMLHLLGSLWALHRIDANMVRKYATLSQIHCIFM